MPNIIWKPHATVAALIERDDYFLLVEEICAGKPVFNQPAGHLEDNESLQCAVVREVLEETTRVFRPEALVGYYRWRDPEKNRTHMRMAFCGTVGEENTALSLDEDIVAAHWLSYREIARHKALRSPLVLRCIDDYRAGRRFPLDFACDVFTPTINHS